MNKVMLIGFLTRDPESKNTSLGNTVCSFTIAVRRRFKDANGEYQSDFINCVAWKQTATFVSSYFHKGSKIAITGSIQTRNYDDKDGKKVYVTEVVVDEAEFVESKTTAQKASTKPDSYNEGNSDSYDEDEFGYEAEDDGDPLEF